MENTQYLKEFIGSRILVIKHSNPSLVGLNGIILDETARTFRVEIAGAIKTIPKSTGKFDIKSAGLDLAVMGDSILMKPEERMKNIRKILKNEHRGDHYN